MSTVTSIEQREDILCVPGVRDHVRGIGKIAGEDAHRVGEGRAIAMQQTLVVLGGANGKQSSRNGEAGGAQGGFFSNGGGGKGKMREKKMVCPNAFQTPDLLGRGGIPFIPPPPELE